MTESITEFLPGIAAMANAHPLLVHFPIALYYGFLAAEVLALIARSESLRQAASWMLYFGTMGAGAAVSAGFQAANSVEHTEEVHAILERHEGYGLTVLALGVLLSFSRWFTRARPARLVRSVEFALALVLVSALTLGADLGGLMVYAHAVAVCCPCESEVERVPVMETPPRIPAAEPAPSVQPPAEGHQHMHTHAHGPHHHKH